MFSINAKNNVFCFILYFLNFRERDERVLGRVRRLFRSFDRKRDTDQPTPCVYLRKKYSAFKRDGRGGMALYRP